MSRVAKRTRGARGDSPSRNGPSAVNPFAVFGERRKPERTAAPVAQVAPPPSTVAVSVHDDYARTIFLDKTPSVLRAEGKWVYDELATRYPVCDPGLLDFACRVLTANPIDVDRVGFLILVFALSLPLLRSRLASGCDRARLEPFLLSVRDEWGVCIKRWHSFALPSTQEPGRGPMYANWLHFLMLMRYKLLVGFDYAGRWRAAYGKYRGTDWIAPRPIGLPVGGDGYLRVPVPSSVCDVRAQQPVDGPIKLGVTGYVACLLALALLENGDTRDAALAGMPAYRAVPWFSPLSELTTDAIKAILYTLVRRRTDDEMAALRLPVTLSLSRTH
jgi:hypothetical protein